MDTKFTFPETGESLNDWKILVSKDENIYTFYKEIYPDEDTPGFYFCVIPNIDCDDAEILFYGTAYFDGVRHLYVGAEQTDNQGYLYYPDLEILKEAITILQELTDLLGCNK